MIPATARGIRNCKCCKCLNNYPTQLHASANQYELKHAQTIALNNKQAIVMVHCRGDRGPLSKFLYFILNHNFEVLNRLVFIDKRTASRDT